jgi:hypothetical protein
VPKLTLVYIDVECPLDIDVSTFLGDKTTQEFKKCHCIDIDIINKVIIFFQYIDEILLILIFLFKKYNPKTFDFNIKNIIVLSFLSQM